MQSETSPASFMDVQVFESLLGPGTDRMKRNISHYEEELVKVFGSSVDQTDPKHIREPSQRNTRPFWSATEHVQKTDTTEPFLLLPPLL